MFEEKDFDFSVREVLEDLFDEPLIENELVVTPSKYQNEMLILPEERIERNKNRKNKKYENDSILIEPDTVVIQNYNLQQKYTVPLGVSNHGNGLLHIGIEFKKSAVFSLAHVTGGSKIAPGLVYKVNIIFMAKEYLDYKHSITFISNKKRIVVKMIAFMPRGVMSFPDEMRLTRTSVLRESVTNVTLKNIGSVVAAFSVATYEPFSIDTKQFIVKPDKSVILTVKCTPFKEGALNGILVVSCSDDVYLYIHLTCDVEEDDIYFKNTMVIFDDTYIGLKNNCEVILYNNSNNVSHYCWKQNESRQIDRELFKKLKNNLECLKEMQQRKFSKLKYFHVATRDVHRKIYDRIYKDEIEELANSSQFEYKSNLFKIIPLSGDIPPKGSVTFSITFSPQKSMSFEDVAYLDSTGLSQRLPMVLKGNGLGPEIILNVKSVKTESICIFTKHVYQVVAHNKGLVNGTLTFKSNKLVFGGKVDANPNKVLIEPDKCHTINVCFTTETEGKFSEIIQFKIEESDELVNFMLTGEAFTPYLELEVDSLDLGDVPYGYVYDKTLTLTNGNEIPIEFEVGVFENVGTKCKHRSYALSNKNLNFIPNQGVIQPYSSLQAEVVIHVGQVGRTEFLIRIDMHRTGNHFLIVPVRYHSIIPNITCVPPEINIPFCFINYPYKRSLQMVNLSSFPGKVMWHLHEEYANGNPINCVLSKKEFEIDADETVNIEATISVSELGIHTLPILFKVYGAKPMELLTITCNGQEPVVSFEPPEIDFGKILLLREWNKELSVVSDSPTEANLVLKVPDKSRFALNKEEVNIPPQETAIINVTCYLVDPGPSKACISVRNGSKEYKVQLKAFGYGTSIGVSPPIDPEIDLGFMLTRTTYRVPITLRNEGGRMHKIMLTRNANNKAMKEETSENKIKSFFQFDPHAFTLDNACKSITIEIVATSKQPQIVVEDFYCFANIGGKIELIMSSLVKSNFIDPSVSFNKPKLDFIFEPNPSYSHLKDEIDIMNINPIPMYIDLIVTDPFTFSVDDSVVTRHRLTLSVNETFKCIVNFTPPEHKRRSFSINSNLQVHFIGHVKTMNIPICGYISYPTVALVPNEIIFENIIPSSEGREKITLRNISGLPVKFKWITQEQKTELTLLKDSILDIESERDIFSCGTHNLTIVSEINPAMSTMKVNDPNLTPAQIENLLLCSGDNDKVQPKSTQLAIQVLPPFSSTIERNITERKEETKFEMKRLLSPLLHNRMYYPKMSGIKSAETSEDSSVETSSSNGVDPDLSLDEPFQSNMDLLCRKGKNLSGGDVDEENAITKRNKDKRDEPKMFKNLFIEPCEGFLKPFESCVINLGLVMSQNTKMKTEIKCMVEGGEEEVLKIEATCTQCNFRLSTRHPSLGRQLFCEEGKTELQIINTGSSPFTYNIYTMDDMGFPNLNLCKDQGSLNFKPQTGRLKIDAMADIVLSYVPENVGYFEKEFLIQVAQLEPINIKLEGFGVFSQIHIDQKREKNEKMKVEEEYFAIGNITDQYIESMVGIPNIDSEILNKNGNMIVVPVDFVKMVEQGWDIVGLNEHYPSVLDIDMAIERTSAFKNFASTQYTIYEHNPKRKVPWIPGLQVSAYIIDFGYCLVNSPVTKEFTITNYGPNKTTVWCKNAGNLFSHGFQLKVKQMVLEVGKRLTIPLTFVPSPKACKTMNVDIWESFQLTVSHGATIPIKLHAIISYPTIKLNHSCVNFGILIGGECLLKTIKITNSGHLDCQWNAVIEFPKPKKKQSFYLGTASGHLNAQQSTLLEVFFQPSSSGPYACNLVISIKHNQELVKSKLIGYCMMPTLAFSSINLKFRNTIPYYNSDYLFTVIQNVSPFPVEFAFMDYDHQFQEENFLINLFLTFNNLKQVLIPHQKVGDLLPAMFKENYEKILELFEDDQKTDEEDNVSNITDNSKAASRDTVTSETLIRKVLLHEKINQDEIMHFAKKQKKSNLSSKGEPSNRYMTINPHPPVVEESEIKSMMFVFHGHPETGYYAAANRTGKQLNLPVYSIDRLIFECLTSQCVEAAKTLLQIINTEFDDVASEADMTAVLNEDEYDRIFLKVELLLTDKEKKPKKVPSQKKQESVKSKKSASSKSTKSSKSAKSSKTTKSDKSGKKKPSKSGDTFLKVDWKLFYEMLKYKISELKTGLVIESLRSNFMKNTSIALNCLLKAAGNIHYIHFIVFSYTYADYTLVQEMRLKLEEERKLKEKEERLQALLDMDPDKYADLPFEDIALLDEHFEKERLEILERRKAREKRKLEKLKPPKKKQDKKGAADKPKKEQKGSKETSKKSKSAKSKSSEESKKKDKKAKPKLSAEEQATKSMFDYYEDLTLEIIHVAEYWDKVTGELTKPYSKQKKAAPAKGKGKDKDSIPKSSRSALPVVNQSHIGLPCWLINKAFPEHNEIFNCKELVSEFLAATPSVKEALQEIEEENSNPTKEYDIKYTVIKPFYYIKDVSEIFLLSNVLDDSYSSISTISEAYHQSKMKRSSIFGSDIFLSVESVISRGVLDQKVNFLSRVILNPGDMINYKVLFKPVVTESFIYKFNIRIKGCDQTTGILCQGAGQIPIIDRSMKGMFREIFDAGGNFTIDEENNIIDLGENIQCGSDINIPMNFDNPNEEEVQMTFHFENKNIFKCEPVLILPAGEKGKMRLKTSQARLGSFSERLYVGIKDNPEVTYVNLRNKVSKFVFEVTPQYIYFDNICLGLEDTKEIRFSNKSKLKCVWKFSSPDELFTIFKVEPGLLGSIDGLTDLTVRIKYQPKKIEVINRIPINVEICDYNGIYSDALVQTTIMLSADSSDVTLDYKNNLELGNIKAKQDHLLPFSITAKGRVPIRIKFDPIKNSLSKYFKLEPKTALLSHSKHNIFKIHFIPQIDMNIKDHPAFYCVLSDNRDEERVIEKFVITVSARVFLSGFEINPQDEMNFGYLTVGSSKKYTFELKNTGKFEFDYTIMTLAKYFAPPKKSPKGSKKGSSTSSKKSDSSKTSMSDKTKKTDKSKKSDKDDKKKKKKRKPTKLAMNGFVLCSSTGTIEPGEKCIIEVEAAPTELKTYSEDIVLIVTENEKDYCRIRLLATGCEPVIDPKTDGISFRDCITIEKPEDFVGPDDIGTHCMYITSQNTLYFKLVSMRSQKTVTINLKNSGFVTANVNAQILSKSHIFSVDPPNFDIESYKDESIKVTFSPVSIGEVTSKLQFTYNSTVSEPLIINLVGEGYLPELEMLEPPVDITNHGLINFNPILIGSDATKCIMFRNCGKISCSVIVEVVNDEDRIFNLKVNHNDKEKHTILVNLKQNEVSQIMLTFSPKLENAYSAEIKIHIVDNVFEMIMICLSGQGYYNDVILEGLDAYKYTTTRDLTNSITGPVGYNLSFGYAALYSLSRKCFRIRNVSNINTYKFKFLPVEGFEFVPTVGHLKPKYLKDVIITFHTAKPIKYTQEPLTCLVFQIEYENPELEMLSWDDRQTTVVWNDDNEPVLDTSRGDPPNSEVTIQEEMVSVHTSDIEHIHRRVVGKLEPEVIIVPDTELEIPINITVVVDYAIYKCEVKNIELPDTQIMKSETVTFQVENIGTSPFQISWSISLEDGLPKSTDVPPLGLEFADEAVSARSHESSLFSDSSGFNTSRTWSDQNELPFYIKPDKIQVESGKTQEFQLKFAPMDAFEYLVHLKSTIENLSPSQRNIDIQVLGKGLLPWYYFELERIPLSNLNIKGMCGVNLEESRIVQFESIGAGAINERKFNLVNPTNGKLDFSFERRTNEDPFTPFTSFEKSGSVSGGKKYELKFVFSSRDIGIFEDYYIFSIPKLNVVESFVLVGICREPKIYFYPSFVNMKPTLMNIMSSSTVVIKNDEDIPIRFSFSKDNLVSEDGMEKLSITPLTGDIQPTSDCEIKLACKSTRRGTFYYNPVCHVERANKPLKLNVTSKCVKVESVIFYMTKENVKMNITSIKSNPIDFGTINLFKDYQIPLTILNEGEVGFYYTITFDEMSSGNIFMVDVTKKHDFLPCKSGDDVFIKLRAIRQGKLENHIIKIEISYGPTYYIVLKANAQKPLCKFASDKLDFGFCLVQKGPSQYYSVNLKFINMDKRPLLLENETEQFDDLTLNFKSAKVNTYSEILIPVYFHPLTEGGFVFVLRFTVDSSKYLVHLKGTGVNLDIDVNPNYIDFLSVGCGKVKKQFLTITNLTMVNLKMSVNLHDKLPFNFRPKQLIEPEMKMPEIPKGKKKDGKKGDKTSPKQKASTATSPSDPDTGKGTKKKSPKLDKTIEVKAPPETPHNFLIYENITISPNNITLAPKSTAKVEVKFKPMQMMTDFIEKIYLEVQDYVKPISVIKGSVSASSYVWDKPYLAFGKVIIGCHYSMSALLINNGNIRGRFKLRLSDPLHYSFEPSVGILLPKSHVMINVEFSPQEVSNLLNAELICEIDNGTQLGLKLLGQSCSFPEPKETLSFVCPVREEVSKEVMIQNNTNTKWTIKPILISKHFHVPNEIIVEKMSVKVLSIIYRPLEMTLNQNHYFALFLPFPEGQGMLYKLVGKSIEPLPIAKISRQITAKQTFTEYFPITNWMNTNQHFKVTNQLLTPLNPKILYKISGSKDIDLQERATKDYKWSIYVVNEGLLDFKVIFKNEDTKEFMFYEISLTVMSAIQTEVITLKTCVRESVVHLIKIENPVDIPLMFDISSNSPNLYFSNKLCLDPYSMAQHKIEYKPYKVEDTKAELNVTTAPLGTFQYGVHLICLPGAPEALVKFKTNLGDLTANYIKFRNTFDVSLDFSAKFEHPAFSVDTIPSIPVGEERCIGITFEPTEIGETQSKMTLLSNGAGEFIYPLLGECGLPKPKGPFYFKPGSSIPINFKNPFNTDMEFFYNIPDNRAFYVRATSEIIRARKSTKIFVGMNNMTTLVENGLDPQITLSAKLMVTTNVPNAKWIFYLQNDNDKIGSATQMSLRRTLI